MAANYDHYLSRPVESIERPQPPNIGGWMADIKSWKTTDRNYGEGKEKTPVVEFTFTLTSPCPDTIEQAEADGLDPAKHINRTVTKDWTLNEEGGQWGVRNMCEHAAGVDSKGLSLGDLFNAAKGLPVKLIISHRAGKGNTEGQFFANVDKVLSPNDE